MTRVLLVDDQELVRSGFAVILGTEPGIDVVGQAEHGAAGVALATELRPDVICMDIEMPVLDGIAASRQIMAAAAQTPDWRPAILVLTTFGHERYLFDALAAGVSGFLLKTARAEQLIDAVRTLAAGHALLGADVTRAVIERVAHDRAGHDSGQPAPGPATGAGAAPAAPAGEGPDRGGADPEAARAARLGAACAEAGLTERERDVLRLIAEGRSNAEIAAQLFVGESTVKTHVSNVLQKLGARDRIQAVVWAHTRGQGEAPQMPTA